MLIKNEHTRGLLLTLTAVLVLSPDALLVRLISVDSWTLLFWRGLLSGITLTSYLLFTYRRDLLIMLRTAGRLGLFSAAVSAVGSIFFIYSLRQTTAANTLVILAATPLLAALASRIFLKEKVPRRTWLAICTAFFGIIILFSGSFGNQYMIGDLLAICASCCWAGNLVIVRQARPLNMIPANAFGNLMIAPLALLCGAQPLAVPAADFTWLLLLGIVVLPISFALITLAPRHLSAPEVSLTLLLETLLGPFWVWLIMHEEPAMATIAGGILILGTIAAHTMVSMKYGAAANIRTSP